MSCMGPYGRSVHMETYVNSNGNGVVINSVPCPIVTRIGNDKSLLCLCRRQYEWAFIDNQIKARSHWAVAKEIFFPSRMGNIGLYVLFT